MKRLETILIGLSFLQSSAIVAVCQGQSGALTESGAPPFYLQAVITERQDPNEHVDIEMFWVST
jgi:hypothetical protein